MAPEDQGERGQGDGADAEQRLVGIDPGPDRAGPEPGVFGAAAEPADPCGQALAGPQRGGRRAGEERPAGDDQGQDQDGPQP